MNHTKTELNSGAPEGLAVPAPLVTKFVNDLPKIYNSSVFTLMSSNKTACHSKAKIFKHIII